MEIPVVLLPLCNPLGYARNWRYPRVEKWESGKDDSVGDSEHLLFLKDSKSPIRAEPKNSECDALTKHILKLSEYYKPFLTIDLHEDDGVKGSYIYISSDEGNKNKIAKKIINLLKKKIPLAEDETDTRSDEIIRNGMIVNHNRDYSIDNLLYSREIIIDWKKRKGPSSKTSIVVETDSKEPLEKRVEAHLEIIKNLREIARLN
ncbi:MAG: hypothetical protein AABY03_02510 [Nanoarchaeota archaeon]